MRAPRGTVDAEQEVDMMRRLSRRISIAPDASLALQRPSLRRISMATVEVSSLLDISYDFNLRSVSAHFGKRIPDLFITGKMFTAKEDRRTNMRSTSDEKADCIQVAS